MSVCPPSVHMSVVITTASEHKKLRTSNFANRLLLAIGRSVLKMGYIAQYDLGHMKSRIRNKVDI